MKLFNLLFIFYVNFTLAFISLLGYLIIGIDLMLLPILLVIVLKTLQLYFISLKNRKENWIIKKDLLYILCACVLLIFGTLFNHNFTLAAKMILYSLVCYCVVYYGFFSLKSYIFSLLLTLCIYFIFLQDTYNQYDNLSFFVYARNYTVFIVTLVLLAYGRSLLFVNALTFVSLARWNFLSLLSAYSKYFVFIILIAAYVKLLFFSFDTGVGLKTSSDDDRRNLTWHILENLDFYILGIEYNVVQTKLDDIFTADSFESLIFERVSYFGIFALPFLILHFRLVVIGNNAKSRKIRHLSYYLFMFPFFNPLSFSIAYYLFYSFCCLGGDEVGKNSIS